MQQDLKIAGCAQYADSARCKQCADGHFLTSLSKCQQIGASLNCLQSVDGQACLRCQAGYTLNAGACLLPYKALTLNCKATNFNSGIVSLQDAQCSSCQPGSFMIDHNGHHMCVEAQYQQATLAGLPNCRMYNVASGVHACFKCSYGFYLTSAGKCVNVFLDGSGNPVAYPVVSYLFAKVDQAQLVYHTQKEWYFDEETTSKCALKSMPVGNDALDALLCAKCQANYYSVVNPLQSSAVSLASFDFSQSVVHSASPVDFYPAIASCASQGPNLLLIDNCQYYFQVTASKIGCLRCQHGFQGTLLDINDNGVQKGHLSACARLTLCNDSIVFSGLDLLLNTLASCHKCIEAARIPFVFFSGQ